MKIAGTVCSIEASETCPVWPKLPAVAHWDTADPANFAEPALAVEDAVD